MGHLDSYFFLARLVTPNSSESTLTSPRRGGGGHVMLSHPVKDVSVRSGRRLEVVSGRGRLSIRICPSYDID